MIRDEVIFESSGSTGEPKRIVRREADLEADVACLASAFPEIAAHRPYIVASVEPHHMYGALWRVRLPKRTGCDVHPETVFSVEELLEIRKVHPLLLFATTPSFLEKAIKNPDFAELKDAFLHIVTSGSALRAETSCAVHALVGTSPLEIYGSTETGSIAYRQRTKLGDLATLFDGITAETTEDGRLRVHSPFALTDPYEMADLVRFETPRTFHLLGRADRRVKILEEFVSLSAVEAAIKASNLVEAVRVEPYGEDVPRLGALIVLTGEGVTERLWRGSDYVLALIREAAKSRIPASQLPRRVRFVRALPVTPQGKTTVRAVQDLLLSACREPIVLEWKERADSLEARLVFPSELEAFQGHFPSLPILPGVAQLYFLCHFAKAVFPDFPDAASTWSRIKFQKVILPNRPVRLLVTRLGEGVFEFSYEGEHGKCASGRVS